MRLAPKKDVRVPRLVGLMAVDAREEAHARGLSLHAPDRPDLHLAVVDHVVRQYPLPGAQVPRDSQVYVWFDFGEGEGGGGIREPRVPGPPWGGLRRELTEPGHSRPDAAGPDAGGPPCCAVLSPP
ncbi:PASTA domain protein [Streptomyces sp. CB02414]|nr:PASTA domain-containing protein [Streptomyces sp. CB02414]OKI88648.1 PASTA domain protein [Streptomyces sp. CB02414]